MVTINDLKAIHFFKGFDEAMLNKVLPLCKKVSFQKDAVIFKEGDPAKSLYFLTEGHIAIFIEIYQNERIIVYTVSPGDSFAWSALVQPHIFTASAKCVQPSTLVEINGEVLKKICDEDSRIGYSVMSQIARLISLRLRDTRLQLISLIEWK